MKEKRISIKSLETPRYYGVSRNNVPIVSNIHVFVGSISQELIIPEPYQNLIEKLKVHFAVENNPSASAVQQFRNHVSALNGYLAFVGKTVDANIGVELLSKFDEKLAAYLKHIQVASRTRADRRRQLKAIRGLHLKDAATPKTEQKGQSALAEVLRHQLALQDIAPKTLAKQAGVNHTTLYRWLAGATPREDTLPALRRLEAKLGMQRDELVKLIEKEAPIVPTAIVLPRYRTRIAEKKPHGLKLAEVDLGMTFIKEWRELYNYKVGGYTRLKRHERGTWRQIPASMSSDVSDLAKRGNLVCPTADMLLSHLRIFFGVVSQEPAGAGCFISSERPTVSLAMCAHPGALTCFLDWLTEQAEGVRHGGHKVFASFVACLVRPVTGYLWQQASLFMEKLPVEMRPQTEDEWKTMCEDSHTFLRGVIQSASGKSRHPDEPIADLLSLPEPFNPIFAAIKRINNEAAACPTGGWLQAVKKRDALLLSLLVSNPLRVRTMISLTWLANGFGTIRGNPAVGWRIVLEPAHLKNGDSGVTRTYDVKVADWVKPMLDEYIEEYRDVILNGRVSPYFFVGDAEGGIWEGMSKRVIKLTRKYIPGSPGFGPHAFRHLVATNWLRKNPGDFLTVAELLNDSLTTVLANYAHLRRDDSFSRYEMQMAGLAQGQ